MKEKLLEIINSIREVKGYEPLTNLDDDANLRTDLGLDSFDLAELTVHIEEFSGIDVFENGIVSTIKEIIVQLNTDL